MEEVLLKNSDAVILLIADEFGILYYWHAGIQLSIYIISMKSKNK
jgi:hypothetical protein